MTATKAGRGEAGVLLAAGAIAATVALWAALSQPDPAYPTPAPPVATSAGSSGAVASLRAAPRPRAVAVTRSSR
jgi:hypothetical protein